jgi:aldehyde:ferredoxin oxidoreductase
LPAYDPRAVQGIGVTYATSTMGADHTAGYAVTSNILKVGGEVDPLKPEGQMELSRNLQVATAAVDATGMCLFIAFALLDQPETFQALIDMINAFHGLDMGADDVMELGKVHPQDRAGLQCQSRVHGGPRPAAPILHQGAHRPAQHHLHGFRRGPRSGLQLLA